MESAIIAHIDSESNIQTVKQHLLGTAKRAQKFAEEFECGDVAYLCGLLHDIGKYSDAFQKRIRNPLSSNRVDHSTAGAVEMQKMGAEYISLGMAIVGHHSGLLDGGNRKFSMAGDGTYFGRCKKELEDYSKWEDELSAEVSQSSKVIFPRFCLESNFGMSFFIRMIYSCLVDGDYLDTEAFMKGDQIRSVTYDSMEILVKRFEDYVEPWLRAQADKLDIHVEICRSRNRILKQCMEKGIQYERGLFTLTVPTGGGKTTASMGFALRHAEKHSMKRIIYVIPYTSVIDQNSAVFKKILGEENVVEHHSGILYDLDESANEQEQYRRVLATENWDAPVIVTTAVQFFESLYSNKSSKCRKLHNISNSVIIFDEAQTIPISYLEPCVAAMAQLVKNYRSTLVLCTATQPALEERFKRYLPDCSIQEICGGAEELFTIFKRTQIENLSTLSSEELEQRLQDREQVLCIVNRRKTAQKIYQNLEGEGVFCLTTLLCPHNRKEKFVEIRERLLSKKTCKVIATSLLEAGVDMDFPQVYRQEAGLDSLIQAAGRCNREGVRPAEERMVYSFRLEGENNKFIAQNIVALQETWRNYDIIDQPEAIAFYFQFLRSLLGEDNLDQKEIMKNWQKGIDGGILPFDTVAKKFRLIENIMRTVYIPLEGTEELLEQIQENRADRNTFRKLGQYSVNIHENHFKELWEAGCLEEISKGVMVLRDMHQYNSNTGLQMDVETGYGILI